jgi:UDP-N-acetylglucosamine 2-epimerase (non-hydrolysing)
MSEPHLRGLPTPPGAGEDPSGHWLDRASVRNDGEGLIHVVAGAAIAPRVAPVVWALAEVGAFAQRVLTSGTRGAELHELDVREGVIELGSEGLMDALTRELVARRPVAVLVHGEGEAALAASIAAARHGLGLVRIGRASDGSAMSRAVARLADLILVPDEEEATALSEQKVAPERVHIVGSPLIGAVRRYTREAAEREAYRERGLEHERYALLVHTGATPPELGEDPGLPLLTIAAGSMGFVERLSLERSAALILSDDERTLEEAAALGVQCRAIGALTSAPTSPAIPLWDGRAGSRIAEVVVANFARVSLG